MFYKNLGDVIKNNKSSIFKCSIEKAKLSFEIMTKKKTIDPIQDAIVSENVLALAGVSMPLLSSIICFTTGTGWADLFGQAGNGLVQMYLGYLICRENIEILSGRSIDKKNKQIIVDILRGRDEVSDIADFKTEYIGDDAVKISAAVKYNSKEIANNIIEVFEDDIKKLTLDQKKQQEIRQLLMKSTDLLFTHTTEIIKNMEEDVQREFPNATVIDLELSKSNIKAEYQGKVSLSTSGTYKDKALIEDSNNK